MERIIAAVSVDRCDGAEVNLWRSARTFDKIAHKLGVFAQNW
jgi:hypothetical protein